MMDVEGKTYRVRSPRVNSYIRKRNQSRSLECFRASPTNLKAACHAFFWLIYT